MKIIGRQDRIDLPDLGVRNIKAKIDTGAYGNALHCSLVELIEKDGKEFLSFILLDEDHPKFRNKRHFTDSFNSKIVKNSSGAAEHRFIIETTLLLFDKKYLTQFSLTDRSKMKFPVLLGRKFLKDKYLVDVKLKYVSYKKKEKK